MAKAGYSVSTGAAVALVATTAKTVLFVIANNANHGVDLKKYRIAFDGVTASAVPVFVEINYLTGATNVTPGTNNTTATVNQTYGRAIASSFSAGYNSTTEPTVQSGVDSYMLTPNGGVVVYDFPLGDTPDSAGSQGFCIRLTAPAAVNARCTMWFERC